MTHYFPSADVLRSAKPFSPDAKPTVYYPGIRLDARLRFSLYQKRFAGEDLDLICRIKSKFPYGFSVDGFGAEPECVTLSETEPHTHFSPVR